MTADPNPVPPALDPARPGDANYDFKALMRRAHAGDQQAWQEIYDRFNRAVVYAIRRHLRQPLRRLLDSADVAQDAWVAFLKEQLPESKFESPEHLGRFLQAVASNKARERYRQYVTTGKRSLSRDEPFSPADIFG